MKPLRYIAITGNIIYILWIVYNGIDEGARNVGKVKAASLLGLLFLLTLNVIIILNKDGK